MLVVDDEPAIRFALRDFLETKGYEVDEADGCAAAEARFRAVTPDAAVLDYRLGDGTALDLLPRLKAIDRSVPLVILTAHGSIDLAVRAVKEGAEQFLTKPVELPALQAVLDLLLAQGRLRRRELAGRTRREREALLPFLGKSASVRRLEDDARRVVGSSSPVLLLGETGTGKGVLARWLHENGPRADEAFVDLNCAGLSTELLESELFGHERGAFTGAVARKAGLLEIAHRGTVFLDEIGDMEPQVQAKLLKVLEEKRFRRVGDVGDRSVDIRLIAATHKNVEKLMGEGRFRSDLYYRISTFPLRLPPLRERPEDIPEVARQILAPLARELGRGEVELDATAVRALQSHSWPGNLREMRNVLERALLLTDKSITADELLFHGAAAPVARPATKGLTLEEVERRHIESALEEHDGKIGLAARALGIPRSTLYRRIQGWRLSQNGTARAAVGREAGGSGGEGRE